MPSKNHKAQIKRSIFLEVLPQFQQLDFNAQDAVFNMLAVKKQMRKQAETIKHQLLAASRGEGGPPSPYYFQIKSFLQKILKIDTQKTRQNAIQAIQKLIDEALKKGQREDLDEKTRLQWFRVVGYLFQVMKSLLHEFDENQIKAELEDLKKLVEDELEKRD